MAGGLFHSGGNRIGIAVGEAANELSWIVATAVWLLAG